MIICLFCFHASSFETNETSFFAHEITVWVAANHVSLWQNKIWPTVILYGLKSVIIEGFANWINNVTTM